MNKLFIVVYHNKHFNCDCCKLFPSEEDAMKWFSEFMKEHPVEFVEVREVKT